MTIDTTTPEGLRKRLWQVVDEYAEKGNWAKVCWMIGGSPKADLLDYVYGHDEGEAPQGAEW